MLLGVQSRFAVLKIEGEEGPRNPNKKKLEKSKPDVKKTNQSGMKKKAPAQNGQSAKNKSKPSKPKAVSDAQWEEWKKKDEQYVDTNYEGELQEAIMQSKLEFEQKKDLYESIRKETEAEKKQAVGGKKKKNKVMSLEQFNNMQDGSENSVDDRESIGENGIESVKDTEFFDRVKQEAKEAIKKENTKKAMKEREPLIDEAISIAQFRLKLEKKDEEISLLKEELSQVKEDLVKVKSRNKKLLLIMGQGEEREKAEILASLNKLENVRDELTQEVSNLHAQLEQERSKVHSLMSADSKGKGSKKRTASETHN